ncbi:MAG: ATP-binding protein [candidate division KSB1 bacterium]|nr:ATP-binding protein [candidate division KSB1 bacterium]MDZ7365054.1 ATP-binding protein [candidate division KSB1 bacterium]MDZ7403448.1 ATP-binding protein [candidate division KSB1 bacterium]
MNETFFRAEAVEAPFPCVKIRFEKSFASSGPNSFTEDPLLIFEEFFNRHLAKGYLHFDLDLGEILFPTDRLIALLIALTVRARRRKGEVKLINVLPTARNNFSTFSALNFLAIEHEAAPRQPAVDTTPAMRKPLPTSAGAAFSSFEAGSRTLGKSPAMAHAAAPPPAISSFGKNDAGGLANIAEPPLIEELARQLEAPPASEAEKRFELRVESRIDNLYRLCDFVTAHAFTAGLSEKEISKMKIAVYEACLNVIEHAYHSRPDEWIDLRVRYSPERFMIIIQDNGLSFKMKPPKDYDVHEAIDERRSGGFGLHIIRRAMDSVEYLPDTVNGNRLVMVKRLK